MFTERGLCPIMPSKKTNLTLIEEGLRELEIVLYDVHTIFDAVCASKAVIYSVNGDRDTHDLFVEDDITRSQTVESRSAAEELLESIERLGFRDWQRGRKSLRLLELDIFETYPSIREGFCTIHDIFSKSEKQNKLRRSSGKIDLDHGLLIDIFLDLKSFKTRLRELYLEYDFVVVLNLKFENPINCYSDDNGKVYVKTNQLSEGEDFDGNLKLIPAVGEFTFDYAVLHDKDQIDMYQFSSQAGVDGLNISNYGWVKGALIKRSQSPPSIEPIDEDIPF